MNKDGGPISIQIRVVARHSGCDVETLTLSRIESKIPKGRRKSKSDLETEKVLIMKEKIHDGGRRSN